MELTPSRSPAISKPGILPRMQRLFAAGALLGALVWLVPGCSTPAGGCQKESDCGPGEYCALGICKRPLGTTGAMASAASSTSTTTGGGATGASGTASGSSTGLGSSTGSSTGTSSGGGTTGNSSGSTGGTSGGADAGNDAYCKPCTQQSDCGDAGNICYQLSDGKEHCLTDCSKTMTCTEAGADCITVEALDGGVLGPVCIPGSNLCPVATDGGTDGGSDGGGDPYCQPCILPSDGGAAFCDDGALCVTFEYQGVSFCAPDCTATGVCSEAGAQCDLLNGGGGSVCAPTSRICPGGDAYCLLCNSSNGNVDCGNGAVCTTLDGIDYFCAPDCTTAACTDVGSACMDGITDANGNAADGCEPANGNICPNSPD
jgi:hypothetical protein